MMMNFTVYHPDFTRALDGDVAASLMLSQILYWYMPDANGKSKLRVRRFGKWWVVKSFKDWQNELGLSKKQSARCVRVLKERGLIATIVGKFNIQTVTHMRLVGVDGKNTLEGPEALFAIANSAFQNALKDIPLTEITTETTSETTRSSSEPVPVAPPPQTLSNLAENPAGQSNPEVQSPNGLTPDEPVATLANVNSKFNLKKAGGLLQTKTHKVSQLVVMWKMHMAEAYPDVGMIKNLSGQDMGKLKLVYDKLGQDAGPTVAWAIANWLLFTDTVKRHRGEASAPLRPHPGYLLTHAPTALSLSRHMVSALAEMAEPEIVVSKPKPPKAVEQSKATASKKEQWESIYDTPYPEPKDPA